MVSGFRFYSRRVRSRALARTRKAERTVASNTPKGVSVRFVGESILDSNCIPHQTPQGGLRSSQGGLSRLYNKDFAKLSAYSTDEKTAKGIAFSLFFSQERPLCVAFQSSVQDISKDYESMFKLRTV